MGKTLQFYPLIYPDDCDPCSFKDGKGWLKMLKRDKEYISARRITVRSYSCKCQSLKENLQKSFDLTLQRVFICNEIGQYGS